jgi:hypothetical protein
VKTVFQVVDGKVEVLGESPVMSKLFKNLDAALDFCRFAEPEEMSIRRIYRGGQGWSEVVGYELSYVGSKGER